MRKTPTFVLGDDMLFHRNPRVEGLGWYIVFGVQAPPELVVRLERCVRKPEQRRKAQELLGTLACRGLMASILRYNGTSRRFFGHDLRQPLPAHMWCLEILAPLPAVMITREDSAPVEFPDLDSFIHHCGRPDVFKDRFYRFQG